MTPVRVAAEQSATLNCEQRVLQLAPDMVHVQRAAQLRLRHCHLTHFHAAGCSLAPGAAMHIQDSTIQLDSYTVGPSLCTRSVLRTHAFVRAPLAPCAHCRPPCASVAMHGSLLCSARCTGMEGIALHNAQACAAWVPARLTLRLLGTDGMCVAAAAVRSLVARFAGTANSANSLWSCAAEAQRRSQWWARCENTTCGDACRSRRPRQDRAAEQCCGMSTVSADCAHRRDSWSAMASHAICTPAQYGKLRDTCIEAHAAAATLGWWRR